MSSYSCFRGRMYVLLADVSVIEYVPRKWPPPFKLVWGQVFIKVVGTTNFSEKKKKRFSIKNLVFLSKYHLEPRPPPKRIKVSLFGKHWKFCVQYLLESSSYIHFKNTKQFNTHKQLTLVKMQQLLLTFITIQIWTLMQRLTACNMCSQSSVQACTLKFLRCILIST